MVSKKIFNGIKKFF